MMHAHSHAPGQAHLPMLAPGMPPGFAAGVADDALTLRHLKTPEQIKAVLPLRDGIDLSAHAAAGAAFRTLEKKETRWASSVPSNAPDA